MQLGDALSDGQANAAAAFSPGGIRPVKAIKDFPAFFRRNEAAGIMNADQPLPAARFQRKGNHAALVRVFQGIGQQNGRQLNQQRFIAPAEYAFLHLHIRPLPFLKSQAFHGKRQAKQGGPQIKAGKGSGLPPRIHPGKQQQILHQIVHMADFSADIAEVFVVA